MAADGDKRRNADSIAIRHSMMLTSIPMQKFGTAKSRGDPGQRLAWPSKPEYHGVVLPFNHQDTGHCMAGNSELTGRAGRLSKSTRQARHS